MVLVFPVLIPLGLGFTGMGVFALVGLSRAQHSRPVPSGAVISPHSLWRGEIGLAITYWVFWVLGSCVIYMIAGALTAAITSGVVLVLGRLTAVSYAVFVSVAIWRSAGLYQGPRLWAVLARVAVVLGAVQLLAAVLMPTD